MTTATILYLSLGAIAGGFINGLAGTGTALFALGFFLIVLPPVSAVAVVTLLAILAGVPGLWLVRADIKANKAKLLQFLIPALLGVPIGVLLLQYINAESLRIFIGVLLVIYGGYFGSRAALPSIKQATPKTDISIGFVGGVLGGLASVSGAIPGMWLSMRPWAKGEIRAVLQPFNVVVLSATSTLLLINGAYNETTLNALLLTIPIALIASQLGIFVFKRLSDSMFRRLLIGLSLVMGIVILIQSFT